MTAPAITGGNPYDDLLDQGQRDTEKAAQAAAFVASKRPDSARWAKVLDLAQKTHLPADVVDRNFDEVSGAVAQKQSAYDRMLSDTPVVDQWMTHPDNATVVGASGPERDSLANVERLVKAASDSTTETKKGGVLRNLGRGLGSGLLSLESGIGHSIQATEETLGGLAESDNPLVKAAGAATQTLFPAAGAVPAALEAAHPVGEALARNAQSNQDALAGNVQSYRDIRSFGNLLDYGAFQVGQAAGSMAAIIAATAAGGPAAGVVTGGLENFGDIRGEIEQVAPEQSDLSRNLLAYALTVPVGALDAITPGHIATKLATKGFGRALVKEAAEHGLTRRVATALTKNALEEGGTEALQEAIQYLGIRAGTGREINADELAPRMVDAFIGGALGGGLLGGATEIPGQRHALRTQRFFQALGATTKDSKLVKDLPQAMQDVVAQMTKDGPVENAYMPVQEWQEYWQSQGSDPAREAEAVTGSREAYDQAVATGSDMVIPMGRYAVTIAPSEHNDALSEVVKFSPDALSVKEVAALQKETAKAAKETDASATGTEDAAATIHETLTERLQAAGMTPEEAATNAEILTQLLRTTGESEGIAPEELLQRYGLAVNREEAGARPAPIAAEKLPLEEFAARVIAAREAQPERAAEREARRMGDQVDPYAVEPDKRDAKARTDAGEFVFARTEGGTLRNVEKVSTDGLVDELSRLLDTNSQEVTGPAVVQDEDFHTSAEGGPVLVNTQAGMRASGRVAARKKTIARLEAELSRRGVEDVNDRIARRLLGTAESEALDFSFEQSAPDTRGEAFRKWFGKSRVTDEKGAPLVVYHGTRSDISAFSATALRSEDGFFFTDAPEDAETFATLQHGKFAPEGDSIMPVYLSLQSPYRVDLEGEPYDPTVMQDLIAEAKLRGDDGVIVSNIQNFMGSNDESTTYIAFSPEQIKSATGNRGTFDPTSPNILEQSTGEGKPPRARIRIAGRSVAIDLLEQANLSSFLHETGHFAVHAMEDLAHRPEASERLRTDLAALREWAGVKEGEAWSEKAHEKVARGFEAFLMEGKAPSSALRSAFAKIRGWMLIVYQHLTALNVRLTPEVRNVFGRLLASEQEIQAAETEQGATPLFTDPAAVGMTPEEADRYARAAQVARETAENEMADKVLGDVRREQTTRWKEERAKVRAEVAAAINEEPASAAYAVLRQGKMPDGSDLPEDVATVVAPGGKSIKLDGNALAEEYAERYPNLRKRLAFMYAKAGGIHPDDAAAMFGFGSGDELIQALLSTDNPRRRIEALTDQRMRDEHGDIVMDGKLPGEAMKSIHGERRSELLALELVHLARKRPGAFRGLAKRAAEPIRMDSRNAVLKAVRDEAARIVAAKTVRELNPRLYQVAEAKAAREAVSLFNKGDIEGAFQAKQRELLNHEIYRAATTAREEVQSIRDYMKRFDKLTTRARIGKAGGTYMEQIDALLERYEFRRVTNTALNRRASLLSWVREQEAAGVEVNIPDELITDARQRNYRDVPVEELRGVRDAVKQIEYLATTKNELLANERTRNMEEARSEIVGGIGSAFKLAGNQAEHIRDIKYQTKKGMRIGVAEHTRMEPLFKALDGSKALGPVWQYFFKPFVSAENHENEMRRNDADAMRRIMSPYTRLERARWFTDKIHIPEVETPRSKATFTKARILMVALNWGSQYSREALMEGYGWNESQVETILSYLDERDWKTVHGIWEYLDTYWPEAQKLQRDVTGLAPEKVEASPTRIRGRDGRTHEVAGGYFPIVFDAELSSRQAQLNEQAQLSEAFGGAGTHAMTRHAHLTERRNTGGRAPLLEMSVISNHLNQVTHDIAFRRAVIDVSRLARDPEIKAAIEGAVGQRMYLQIAPWLKDIAGDRPHEYSGFLAAMAGHARQGATVVGLGVRFTSAVLQVLGYATTAKEIGVKYAALGLRDAYKNPAAIARNWAFITERSGQMRDRLSSYDRDVRDKLRQPSSVSPNLPAHVTAAMMAVRDATGGGAAYFALIGYMDLAASMPTWLGAYRKAMDGALENVEGGDEQGAIDYADSVVRITQAAGGAKDLAAVQRGGEWQRLGTMFYSSMGTLFNQYFSTVHEFRQTRNVPQLIAAVTLLWFAPAVMEEMLRGHGPGDDDDDEWWKWLIEKELFYPLQTIVGIRDLANALEQKIDTGRNDFSISPASRAGEAVVGGIAAAGKALTPGGDDLTHADARNLVEGAGYVAKLPTGQAFKSLDYLHDWLNGSINPSNPVQGLWQMLVTGKPKE